MKEGSAYIDRLLSMSTEDLKAYNEAYTEKLEAAEEAGESIYKKDLNRLQRTIKTKSRKPLKICRNSSKSSERVHLRASSRDLLMKVTS
jgi:hypothetical protein